MLDLEKKIREERDAILKEKRRLDDSLKVNSQKLLQELIAKHGFAVGDVIGNIRENRLFVIKSFHLDYNDFLADGCDDLAASLFTINKSNKIDKKKKAEYKKTFISRFKIVGKYDFDRDIIVFSENNEKFSVKEKIRHISTGAIIEVIEVMPKKILETRQIKAKCIKSSIKEDIGQVFEYDFDNCEKL